MARRNRCKAQFNNMKGMTLIELMIVVVVLGVLAAIAYPSYTNHVLKGHRAQAKSDMIKIQLELERTYSSGYDMTIVSGGTCSFCDSDDERYQFSLTSANAYTITATPQSTKGQNNDDCGTMTVKGNGESTPLNCW